MTNRGSEWRRWDPHIHAPGTVFNDQFGGTDPWSQFLTTLESRTPIIEAVGITDYYITDTYEKCLEHKIKGRLPNVKLLFPNIEVRLSIAAKSGFINLHLLVNPQQPDHLQQVRRFLSRLEFDAFGDRFSCSRDDLIRLGLAAGAPANDARSALLTGATQFKVKFEELRELYVNSDWAKANMLVAVAGSEHDGTSGLRNPSDATIRQEVEKFAHIIFASSSAQREFWIGRKTMSPDAIRQRYSACKPCLHGSDAHKFETIGVPENNRLCWIKGDPTFDSLKQACIDPERRAIVAEMAPGAILGSQVITQAVLENAAWAGTPLINLNPGLVAIIGARGSGKTALADVLAAAANSVPSTEVSFEDGTSASFLVRAREHIGDATATLVWGNGERISRRLIEPNDDLTIPRVRYLSQRFVEELCSSKGLSDELVREIERVIFESHPTDEREGASSFAEFREWRTARFQAARARQTEIVTELSLRIADERQRESSLEDLSKQLAAKRIQVVNLQRDQAQLPLKGNETLIQTHTALSTAAQQIRSKIDSFKAQARAFELLQDEADTFRANKSPELLRALRTRFAASGLSNEQWNDFLLVYDGDVDIKLTGYKQWAATEIAKLQGTPPAQAANGASMIPPGTDPSNCTLSVIDAELARLVALIGADQTIRARYKLLSDHISKEGAAARQLEQRHAEAEGASTRRKEFQQSRTVAYLAAFDALTQEEAALASLYKPLSNRIANSTTTLSRLKFSVRRVVDVAGFATQAEESLFDLRRAGPLYGRGALAGLLDAHLRVAWESGSSVDLDRAMTSFINKYMTQLIEHAPSAVHNPVEYKQWMVRFAEWLFGLEHISIHYAISYDGVDIRHLSPGTRGVVLLLLYLALDDEDTRPLLIDQPEENLDPRSVFQELVPLFVAAKDRRQVIVVTHNANLVVNTDAEQIIIAKAGPAADGHLPIISYASGGLDDEGIRKEVCEILEGGADAFRERARRLRVPLQ